MRIGLALSGGGFRATLFHLGVVHFLQRADLLGNVRNICAASGGSITAAHLVQNWNRYRSASTADVLGVSSELYRFVNHDIRGRILRRLPFRRRSTLLQKFLSRDLFARTVSDFVGTLLGPDFQQPYLHILATNLSAPALCSFSADGYSVDQLADGTVKHPQFWPSTQIPLSLAVTASSAFPAMFPPINITAADFGASKSLIPHLHTLTDGGVYDNLCVRKFDQLNRDGLAYARVTAEELGPYCEFIARLLAATPLDPLSQRLLTLAQHTAQSLGCPLSGCLQKTDVMLQLINRLLSRSDLCLGELWSGIIAGLPAQRQAEVRTQMAVGEASLLYRLRINRSLLDAKIGGPERPFGSFDLVLFSDASQLLNEARVRSVTFPLATAIRATDVLFGRLAVEDRLKIASPVGYPPATKQCILSIANVTDCDPLDSDTQRRLPLVRTDFDRFGRTEASALVQHGYSVARKVLSDIVTNPDQRDPWLPSERRPPSPSRRYRHMKRAADRRLRFFSVRDWVSYVHVVLALAVCLVLGWACLRVLEWRRQYIGMTLAAASYFSENVPRHAEELVRDYKGTKGHRPTLVPSEPASTAEYVRPTYDAFSFVSDLRVFDLQFWTVLSESESATGHSPAILRRRVRVKKNEPVNKLILESRTSGTALTAKWIAGGEAAKVTTFELTPEIKVTQVTVDVEKYLEGREFEVDVEFVFWDSFQRPDQQWAGALIGNTDQVRVSLLVLAPSDRKLKGAWRSIGRPDDLASPGLRVDWADGSFLCKSDDEAAATLEISASEHSGVWCYWEIWSPIRNRVYRINWRSMEP